MVDKIPIAFRKGSNITATIDFFDIITGIAYKAFYLYGATKTGGSNSYHLTTDSSISSDDENFNIQGTGKDIDFDIKIGKGFTISAEDAIIVSSQNADTGENQTLTWTLRHVAPDTTETSVGTQVGDTISGGAGNEFFLKTTLMSLTKTKFNAGDTLRFNFTSSSGANCFLFFDPSGIRTQSTESPNYAHRTKILIPIEVDF